MTYRIMEENKINLIEPLEWENTHIESHKELNRYVSLFYGRLNNIEDKVNEIWEQVSELDGEYSSSFSEINKIKIDIEDIVETLGCMASEIKDLKEKVNKPKKYLVKNFEWILDTDTESLATLETIELDWTYLVQIVENKTVWNPEVASYSLWRTAIANKEYTPWVYLLSKWWHAVLEYDFTVILTEI